MAIPYRLMTCSRPFDAIPRECVKSGVVYFFGRGLEKISTLVSGHTRLAPDNGVGFVCFAGKTFLSKKKKTKARKKLTSVIVICGIKLRATKADFEQTDGDAAERYYCFETREVANAFR